MATTKSKLNKLQGLDYNAKTPNMMFPSDLLGDEQDGAVMTLFINTIQNGQAKLSGVGVTKNKLESAYGEAPVIHTVSRGLQKDNGGDKVFSNTFVRSDQSITLPMPKNLNFSSVARWTSTELGQAGMAIDTASDFDKLNTDNGAALAKMMGASTIGSIASKFGLKGKELVELSTASIANNYAETMFKGVDNRTFSFSWTLTPRNQKEADMISDILRALRFHQLPEFRENIGNGNAYLLYPSSFDIVFWLDGQPNIHIPRISTCALTSLDTNYTPNGKFIRNTGGSPVSYTLSLQFSELTINHKGLVAEMDDQDTSF